MSKSVLFRTLSSMLLVLSFLGFLGVVWGGVVGKASAALPQAVQLTPTPLPDQPPPAPEWRFDAESPDISFIDSPTATCYRPDQHKDTCYIDWGYLYVTASSSQYIISMTVSIDNRLRAYHSGFFQTYMYVPADMFSPGFRVTCGPPGSGGNPKLGSAHSYTLRARETGGLSAANYGTVYCPADVVPPASLDIIGPPGGISGVPYDFTASVSPPTTTLPLTYTWQVADQPTIVVTGGLSVTQTSSWKAPGEKLLMITAENAAGSITITHTFNLPQLYLPFITKP
jgi:hypothetical protein